MVEVQSWGVRERSVPMFQHMTKVAPNNLLFLTEPGNLVETRQSTKREEVTEGSMDASEADLSDGGLPCFSNQVIRTRRTLSGTQLLFTSLYRERPKANSPYMFRVAFRGHAWTETYVSTVPDPTPAGQMDFVQPSFLLDHFARPRSLMGRQTPA